MLRVPAELLHVRGDEGFHEAWMDGHGGGSLVSWLMVGHGLDGQQWRRSAHWLALLSCGPHRPAGAALPAELGLPLGDQGTQHVGMLLEHGRSFRDVVGLVGLEISRERGRKVMCLKARRSQNLVGSGDRGHSPRVRQRGAAIEHLGRVIEHEHLGHLLAWSRRVVSTT
jgi:hypothetical protein